MNGPFIWQSSNIFGGAVQVLADCETYGWDTLFVKVFNESNRVRIKEIEFCKSIYDLDPSVKIVPWAYIRPDTSPRIYAELLDKYFPKEQFVMLNAEVEWIGLKELTIKNWVKDFFFSQKAPRHTILSTFSAYKHGEFPFDAWFAQPYGCNIFGPQCYGSYPEKQLEASLQYCLKRGLSLLPTLRGYIGDGVESKPKAEALAEISIEWIKEHAERVMGVNFWYYEGAWEGIKQTLAVQLNGNSSAKSFPWSYNPGVSYPEVKDLQLLLRKYGLYSEDLDIDGKPGKGTDKGFFALTGQHLLNLPKEMVD